MRTLTLDRIDSNDLLFAALNDSTFADLKNSREFYQAQAASKDSLTEVLGMKLKKIFCKN